MQGDVHRHAPPAGAGGSIVLTTACVCGFIFSLLIPLHGALRVATENPLLHAWKEVVLAVGLLATLTFGIGSGKRSVWQLMSVLLLTLFCYIAFRAINADPWVIIDGCLTMFGPACAGLYYWNACHKIFMTGTTPRSLLAIFLVAGFLSLWVAAEHSLGLTSLIVTEDQNLPRTLREGITRARASFDSPMTAGQWMWFHSVLAFACGFIDRSRAKKIFLMTLSASMSIALVFTVSRGPYVLAALSAMLLFLFAVALKQVDLALKFLIGLAIIIVIAIPLAVSVTLDQDAAALKVVAESVSDQDERANSLRAERIKAGWELLGREPLWGESIENISMKHLAIHEATQHIRENTFLDTHSGLGLAGLLYVLVWYLMLTVISTTALNTSGGRSAFVWFSIGLCLWLPWAMYGFVAPTLNTRFGAAISWAILGVAVAAFEIRSKIRRSNHGNHEEHYWAAGSSS
jgi:O-antigen ligase